MTHRFQFQYMVYMPNIGPDLKGQVLYAQHHSISNHENVKRPKLSLLFNVYTDIL